MRELDDDGACRGQFSTEIVAHRGGSSRWPENSGLAFRDTLTLAVDQVEFDVQLTSDGVPVVFHDATLERVTNGTGPVADKSLSSLKGLSINEGGGSILMLQELIELLVDSDITLRCEFKSGVLVSPPADLIEKSLALLSAAGLLERSVFTGFHLPTVTLLRQQLPAVCGIAWLVARQPVALIGAEGIALLTVRAGIESLSMHHSQVDDEMLQVLDESGIRLGAFGLQEEADMVRMLEKPVAVLTTDRPRLAIRLREALSSR